MKIYRVVVYDNAHAFYFYPTKKAAQVAVKQLRAEYADSEWPDASIEIEDEEFEPTRAGIAAMMQGFVDYTCINEH